MSDRIADELAIRQLVARYADAVNDRDAEAWAATWAADGQWEILGQTLSGRDTLVSFWRGLMEGFPFVVQLPTAGSVRVDADAATGRWTVAEFGRGHDGRGVLNLGVYADMYVREPEGWRFSARRFRVLYMGPPDLSAPPAGAAP